jgi:DNA-binding NarL/FixJ family response regulator
MPDKIHVGLVEDQYLFREGMKALLGSWQEFDVVFESADGYSVISKLKETATIPHVMLVDLSLPPDGKNEFGGVQVTEAVRAAYPEVKIIILSVHTDENFITHVIEHGAHGYLVKDSDPREVKEAILAVHRTGSYVNQRTLEAIQRKLSHKERPKQSTSTVVLTKREEEVLQLICRQFTAEEIAEKLFISVKTVNGHRTNLMQKTGAKNVAGLVMYAIKNNVVAIGDSDH